LSRPRRQHRVRCQTKCPSGKQGGTARQGPCAGWFFDRSVMKKAATANWPRFEHDTLRIWERDGTFAKSLEQRQGSPRFSFYDGPPFANGLPHYGHVVPVTVKDAVTRYKTMRGYYVPRRNGWDTHGLPVEYEIEKELGLKGKREIYEYGVAKFIEKCRASVFRYKTEWED